MTAKRAKNRAVRSRTRKVSAVRRLSGARVGPSEGDGPRNVDVSALVRDVREMIEAARKQVAVVANTSLVTLHWQVGGRVHREVLKEQRAAYGARIVKESGKQLSVEYGSGFNEKSLRHMIRFARRFPTRRLSPRCGDN